LNGEIGIKGAKNAVLPLLAAALLVSGEVLLRDCPRLNDIDHMLEILAAIGCQVRWEGQNIAIDAGNAAEHRMPEELSKRMRSSIFMLGPALARFGKARFSYPGGCEIGLRPIDLHLSSLRAMGAQIIEERGHIYCSGKLIGAKIHLDYPSVGATENIMMAAVGAQGDTVIYNAAREPEIEDLAAFLNACGAEIKGAGQSSIEIRGGTPLKACEYVPLRDRIVAGTLLVGAAMTGGEVFAKGARAKDMQAVLQKLSEMGCTIGMEEGGVRVRGPKALKAVRRVETNPHPSFPTDMQAQIMSALCVARGSSVVVENVFESRFGHAAELCRMGADIQIDGKIAVVRGVKRLYGAKVVSRDLRGGAALTLAGLRAVGETIVTEVELIDRGYERMEEMLRCLGAGIERIETEE
jgi:UDP-N-acetylglucosamine 1-carboxyvinyltransferase